MRRRRCPQCRHRLPYAAQRCLGCGWLRHDGTPAERTLPWSRIGIGLATLAILLFSAVWFADRYLPALGDWYAGFAARNLPSSLSRYGPTETERGAFYFCARRVAKQLESHASIATFDGEQESRTSRLEEGLYRVEAVVEESTETGERRRHAFACTVRFQRGQWILEALAVRDFSPTSVAEAGAGGPD